MGQARTICLVGHSGTGKTALTAALLTRAGTKEQITLDASQEEKERGHTLDMGFGAFQVDGVPITLLDTPGGDEFIEEMYKGIPIADLTVLVVNAEKAVEVVTERAWEISGGAKRPTIVLVNLMDKENANFDKVLADLRGQFEGKFVAVQMPIRSGEAFTGMVDLVSNRLVSFADKGKKDIPAELADEVEMARGALLEEVAAADDELMMKFLDEAAISESEIASNGAPASSGRRAVAAGGSRAPRAWVKFTAAFSKTPPSSSTRGRASAPSGPRTRSSRNPPPPSSASSPAQIRSCRSVK